MEPLLIGYGSSHRAELTDLAVDLVQKSAGFRRSLPESLLASLADLVRSMNCYYSNLIEGHVTHPIDIERALKGDFSNDSEQRDLQLEAKAHIATQRWIDEGAHYEPHWSFIAPERPSVPAVRAANWPKTDVDRFLLARLERESIQPSPDADRAT